MGSCHAPFQFQLRSENKYLDLILVYNDGFGRLLSLSNVPDSILDLRGVVQLEFHGSILLEFLHNLFDLLPKVFSRGSREVGLKDTDQNQQALG